MISKKEIGLNSKTPGLGTPLPTQTSGANHANFRESLEGDAPSAPKFQVRSTVGFRLQRFNLSALLRRLEPGGFEMLVVAEVFPATFREHHFKGHTIGKTEPAFPGLPPSS